MITSVAGSVDKKENKRWYVNSCQQYLKVKTGAYQSCVLHVSMIHCDFSCSVYSKFYQVYILTLSL